MVTISGYDVAYSHRGSWKATRNYKGSKIDEIPVAWDEDWMKGKPPTLKVWFKDFTEATSLFNAGNTFPVAIARKRLGSASSDDIHRLFLVKPIEALPDAEGPRGGLLCEVVRACPRAGEQDAPGS